jgi:type IV secretory pathway TraG/TraD family ATPase VirD4
MRTAKGDNETAPDLSRTLGEHEVERVRESESVRGRAGPGVSRQVVHEREAVVTPGEIARLPDLTGYLAIAGDLPIARFKATYRKYPVRAAPIEEPKSSVFAPSSSGRSRP